MQIMHHDSKDRNQTLFCVMLCFFISRLSVIILVNVVLNRTVAFSLCYIGPDASASAPRSFVARLVKIVSFFLR